MEQTRPATQGSTDHNVHDEMSHACLSCPLLSWPDSPEGKDLVHQQTSLLLPIFTSSLLAHVRGLLHISGLRLQVLLRTDLLVSLLQLFSDSPVPPDRRQLGSWLIIDKITITNGYSDLINNCSLPAPTQIWGTSRLQSSSSSDSFPPSWPSYPPASNLQSKIFILTVITIGNNNS